MGNRLSKIYTRTGDDGSTGLLGPGRVSKSAPRVEAYGSVDELNAALGVARSLDRQSWLAESLGPADADGHARPLRCPESESGLR